MPGRGEARLRRLRSGRRARRSRRDAVARAAGRPRCDPPPRVLVRPAPEDELVTGSAQGPAAVPPGWPAVVRPPGAPHWERTALNWLLDLCPADYRGYPVLARHPALLAWLAGHHLDGQLQATRRALATARADLADVVPPPVLTEAL